LLETQLLEIRDLVKDYEIGLSIFRKKFVRAVDKVSFDIKGDNPVITSLVGESGSGKSTLALMILRILKPTSGYIKYKGIDIFKMSKSLYKDYLKDVQPVFQDPYSAYNPFYRIDRVFNLVIRKFNLASSKNEARKLIYESMMAVGLRPEDILGRYPHQLSGGERQRVMLARLVCLKPKILIADEPVSMIDVSLRSMFLNTLLNFKEQFGMSTIFITHDLTNISYLGGDVLIMCNGRVVEAGPVEIIIKEPIHPYTKILISSIPHTTPDFRWKDKFELNIGSIVKMGKPSNRCIFCDRCPDCTKKCLTERPPLFELRPYHRVACFMHH